MEPVKLCSKCKERPQRQNHRYCKPCHAFYMQIWRIGRPLTEEQRKKDIARSYAGVYKRRGKLKQKPCVICKSDKSQMHHPNYDEPLRVVWLCRRCHLESHKLEDLLKSFERSPKTD